MSKLQFFRGAECPGLLPTPARSLIVRCPLGSLLHSLYWGCLSRVLSQMNCKVKSLDSETKIKAL